MIRHLLNTDVDVWRASYSSDGRGGRTRATAKVATVRARVMPLSSSEGRVAGETTDVHAYAAHFTLGTDVLRGDELDAGLGRRLRVLATGKDSSRTYLRADCQLLEASGA